MTLEFNHVAWISGLVIGWSGMLIGVIRILIGRMVVDIERRMEDVVRQAGRLDGDVKRLMTELPLQYQRREDSVRETTQMLVRIDALGGKVDGFVRRDDYIRDMPLIHAKLDALVRRLEQLGESR